MNGRTLRPVHSFPSPKIATRPTPSGLWRTREHSTNTCTVEPELYKRLPWIDPQAACSKDLPPATTPIHFQLTPFWHELTIDLVFRCEWRPPHTLSGMSKFTYPKLQADIYHIMVCFWDRSGVLLTIIQRPFHGWYTDFRRSFRQGFRCKERWDKLNQSQQHQGGGSEGKSYR